MCHCFSVCRSSGPSAPATLPGLCTVCVIRLVLTINNIFPPLSTLHVHTTNLESVGGADFHRFSTQRVCSLLLNWSSVAHCISLVPFHAIFFSHFSDCISYRVLNKPSKRRPWDYSEDPMKHKLVFIRTVFFNLVCFPYKADSCNLPCSHVYANTRQYICLLLHRFVLVGLWGYQMELIVHKW